MEGEGGIKTHIQPCSLANTVLTRVSCERTDLLDAWPLQRGCPDREVIHMCSQTQKAGGRAKSRPSNKF